MNRTIWLSAGLLVSLNGVAKEADSESYSQYEAAVGMGFDQGLSAILELEQNYRLVLGNDGGAFDYIMQRGRFDNPDIPFDWYVGTGIWTAWDKDEDLGLRAPLGLNWTYRKRINFYGQVHPELVLHDEVKLQLGGAVGITYKF